VKPLSSLTAVVLPLSASIEATGRGPWSSPRTKTSTPRSPSPHQRSCWCRCCRQPARPTARRRRRCRREALGASVRGEHDVSLGTLRWWVVPLVRSGCLSDRFRPVTRTSPGADAGTDPGTDPGTSHLRQSGAGGDSSSDSPPAVPRIGDGENFTSSPYEIPPGQL